MNDLSQIEQDKRLPASRMDIDSWRGAYMLFKKELFRFWRVAF